jgi:hypothetical protein
VYHLLPVRHTHFDVRIKFMTSECLVLHFVKLLCIYTHVPLTNPVKPHVYLKKIRQTLFGYNSHPNPFISPTMNYNFAE